MTNGRWSAVDIYYQVGLELGGVVGTCMSRSPCPLFGYFGRELEHERAKPEDFEC